MDPRGGIHDRVVGFEEEVCCRALRKARSHRDHFSDLAVDEGGLDQAFNHIGCSNGTSIAVDVESDRRTWISRNFQKSPCQNPNQILIDLSVGEKSPLRIRPKLADLSHLG